MILIPLVIVTYALGMFPSAELVARASGVDITSAGSGNPGASNVTRILGWQRGALVFALDAAKGAIAAGLGWWLVGRHAGYICAAAATIGHCYPVLRRFGSERFRGGKGVATGGGAMFVLQPLLSAIAIATWFALFGITRKASIASLVAVPIFPIGAAVLGAPAWEVVAITLLGAIVMIKHAPNIKRLIKREELSFDKNQ